MSDRSASFDRPGLNPTSKMSFAVAACAFAAAGLGLLVNHWMSGWMAVGGMAGVGLFYMAVGLLNIGTANDVHSDEGDLTETTAHRLSGVGNVDNFAIQQNLEVVGSGRTEQLTNARR